MANTFTQLHIHLVFAVKYRAAVIEEEWEPRLHKYMTGIVQNNGNKLLAINSVADHMHMLIGLSPKYAISDIMRLVKGDSAEFINKNKLTRSKFHWQEGYGAFSVSHWDLNKIIKYILAQKLHHQKLTLRQEYRSQLNQNDIEFDDQYIFQEI